MQETDESTNHIESKEHSLKEKISALGQKIIGEIETIGGILTGDPNTAAEGEFNLEVGEVREEVEEELNEAGETEASGK